MSMRDATASLISRTPARAYRNLLLAALIGVPLGNLVSSLVLAIFASTAVSQSWVLVADALPVSLFVYPLMALMVLLYGMPSLWLALRLRMAGPAVALLIAVLPALGVWWPGDWLGSLVLAISAATGVAFVLLAYRGVPDRAAADAHPGSG